ncbi:aminotransferase [Acidihalobacter yilgarnensis]|uniref:Aminotransferase n=1 Tax=Acidihalobacter yilgarnensis TaxID=2819280 RepID=A0A1D8ILS4_9GAMM|nr:aspartate aminotransferase family protein [Acidihalobacter yilgarnensis]AOU97415.1 aminotransferase [Acidihalobacter yilgarnensis]
MSHDATAAAGTTDSWQQQDRAHHLHPFTDYKALNAKGSRIITRAEGCYIWDSEGHKLLDGMAGLWCVNIGYGRKELAEAAYAQMQELPYYNNFFQCSTPPAVELSALLAELTPPHLNHVFFTGSGSESNDTVLRMVRYYWKLKGKPYKKIIIARDNAYHGSTVAGASLSGMKAMHAQGDLPIPGIVHIEQPYHFGVAPEMDPAEFGLRAARALERKIDELGECNVAAFIAEPIQGAGGVIIPPDSYWPEIKRICAERDILFVADEVITGFGRLGTWFGSQYYGIEPDLMSIAKGLSSGYQPIGGVMVSDKVAEVVIDQGGEFFHGYTYSGHPVAAAVAAANLRILRDERIIERAGAEVGPYLQKRWAELADHPLVGETRGVGMLAALELVRAKSPRQDFAPAGKVGTLCRDICVDNGLVMRAVRDTMIISPPLVLTLEQVDELIEKAARCLDLTAARLHEVI